MAQDSHAQFIASNRCSRPAWPDHAAQGRPRPPPLWADRQYWLLLRRMRVQDSPEERAEPTRPTAGGFKLSVSIEDMFAATGRCPAVSL